MSRFYHSKSRSLRPRFPPPSTFSPGPSVLIFSASRSPELLSGPLPNLQESPLLPTPPPPEKSLLNPCLCLNLFRPPLKILAPQSKSTLGPAYSAAAAAVLPLLLFPASSRQSCQILSDCPPVPRSSPQCRRPPPSPYKQGYEPCLLTSPQSPTLLLKPLRCNSKHRLSPPGRQPELYCLSLTSPSHPRQFDSPLFPAIGHPVSLSLSVSTLAPMPPTPDWLFFPGKIPISY